APTARAAQAPPIVIRTGQGNVTRIGAFHVARDPTLRNAIRRWGAPSSRTSRYGGSACTVRWKRLKITASFGFLGAGGTACESRLGRIASVTLRSSRFETTGGIHVGSATEEIAEAHPEASYEDGRWIIDYATSDIGEDGNVVPTITAQTRGGRVTSLSLWIGGAGD
ncbi:MAG TPA: hypothetical protein VN238_02160, partial [Solirubrobacteraceae bacterium]|nr:hypothetical protein [Solirubrobacteraceae bacterium]